MDKDLIIKLYKSQYKNIVLYLMKIGASLEEAEDITQDSFIKVYEYITEIEIKNFNSYIFKIAINNFKNKKRRDKLININYIFDEGFYEKVKSNEVIDENILREEQKGEISEVLNSLKEIYKNLLILKYDLELSYEEISNLLNIDKNTVKVYLYRARKIFIKEYEKKYERYR